MNTDTFIDRILELLVNPTQEWERIRHGGLDDPRRYALNHLIPVILLNCTTYFIGVVFVARSHGIPGAEHLAIPAALIATILMAATYVGVLFAGPMIVQLIATSFDSEPDEYNAFKLIAFSLYPFLVFGSLHVISGFRLGAWVGFYGIYLLYKGFPVLLKTPQEKSAHFTLVVSLAMIGMFALAFSLINTISGAGSTFRIGL